ncbi:hypothetical protein CC86DRAFT_374630 [Ophiobolus disseminans]|uniref:Rrn9 domain-containing protein n=1 Tax=Ophiobolus disseminans TaxID=1469910 RepID=A0A6A6ZFV3_9PLEO|nr:hypothetical protein CC86DRAFT_374630 [Ophiobolus disseminans]
MSLFGGDGSASPSQLSDKIETEHSQPAPEPSSPSVDGNVNPPSAQPPKGLHYATESGADDDLLTDSESDSDESDEGPPIRLNRFQGAPAAWKAHTAADRQIAVSLEQTQNRDLSAHLYNAHSLKRRAHRPLEDLTGLEDWQARDHWLKKDIDLEFTDVLGEKQTHLVPSKDWTAWPVLPTKITTLHEQSESHLGSERNEWKVGGAGVQDAGQELREELLATFLRLAKEQWRARDTDDIDSREELRTMQSRSRPRSKSARSARSTSRADVRMKDDDDRQTDDVETQDEDEHNSGQHVSRRQAKKPQPETFLQAAFLADDERASKILQPAINSVLAKLDGLALAVHRTRLNHFGRGADSDASSHSEFTSGAESSEPRSRSSSRPQSRSRPGSKRSARPVSRATSVQYRPATMKARIDAQNNPSENASDLDTDSSVDADISNKASVSRTPSKPRSITKERTPSANRGDTWRAGLMDWSEVLGLAAAKGWDQRAISRTAQRCAALFGESMSLVPLEEGFATKTSAEPVQYTPSSIPAPDVLFRRRSAPPKRPYFQSGTLRCPHVDCYGHAKDFEAPYRVVQHCIRVHEYDPRTNDSDNEDRTVGGVHIDGFLQPIPAQRGWRERGKSRASSEKRQDVEGQDADDAMVIDSD